MHKYLPASSLTLLLIVASFTTSCTSIDARKVINDTAGMAIGVIDQRASAERANTRVLSGMYLSDGELKSKNISLPSIFSREISVPGGAKTFQQWADHFASMTGLNVMITDDAQIALTGDGSSKTGAVSQPQQQANVPMPMTASDNASDGKTYKFESFTGSYKNYLEQLTRRAGLSWRAKGESQVIIYELETKAFPINLLPGGVAIENVVTGAGQSTLAVNGGNTTTTTSGLKMTSKSDLSPWDEIVKSVNNMLVSPRARVSALQTANTITISDTPDSIQVLSEMLEKQNIRLSKRVDIYAKVFLVKKSKSDDNGVNWSAVYNWLGQNASVSLSSSGGQLNGAASLTFKAIGGPWAGSQAIFNALQTQGDVSEVTHAFLSPMVNRTVPMFDGKQISYIESQSVVQGTTTTTTTTNQSTFSTGFSMLITPTVFDRNKIGLRYSIDLTTLDQLATNRDVNGVITSQSPDTSKRNVGTDTVIRNGETILISGLESSTASDSLSGPVNQNLWMLGGSQKAHVTKNVVVIALTAFVR